MTRGCEIALTTLEWTESKKPERKEMQKRHAQSFVAAAVHVHHPATCFNMLQQLGHERKQKGNAHEGEGVAEERYLHEGRDALRSRHG